MPWTKVVLYCEEDGSCPFLEWISDVPAKVQDKCFVRIERLRELGHELRRPEADFLRDGVYEPRTSNGTKAAIVSHGIVKERAVPPREIDLAIERKKLFEANPAKHQKREP